MMGRRGREMMTGEREGENDGKEGERDDDGREKGGE